MAASYSETLEQVERARARGVGLILALRLGAHRVEHDGRQRGARLEARGVGADGDGEPGALVRGEAPEAGAGDLGRDGGVVPGQRLEHELGLLLDEAGLDVLPVLPADAVVHVGRHEAAGGGPVGGQAQLVVLQGVELAPVVGAQDAEVAMGGALGLGTGEQERGRHADLLDEQGRGDGH